MAERLRPVAVQHRSSPYSAGYIHPKSVSVSKESEAPNTLNSSCFGWTPRAGSRPPTSGDTLSAAAAPRPSALHGESRGTARPAPPLPSGAASLSACQRQAVGNLGSRQGGCLPSSQFCSGKQAGQGGAPTVREEPRNSRFP